jgi:hypothetical protein
MAVAFVADTDDKPGIVGVWLDVAGGLLVGAAIPPVVGLATFVHVDVPVGTGVVAVAPSMPLSVVPAVGMDFGSAVLYMP